MTLRPYQLAAVDKTMAYIRKSKKPCIIEAAGGAGKSHIIAEIARLIHDASGKRVLCLAPSAELVKQNASKFIDTGNPCSIYSASAGRKELRNPVVFATPMSILPAMSRIGGEFAAAVIDEAHNLTPTVKKIVDAMLAGNPNARTIGLSATPYRTLEGYIYRTTPSGATVSPGRAYKPYFERLTYRITAETLIEQGYLCEETILHPSTMYKSAWLKVLANGKFDDDAVREVFEDNSETARIVSEVIEMSHGRRGTIIFAATIRHAMEIFRMLPEGQAGIVAGADRRSDREMTIARYKAQEYKYLVNVSTLTTGFDAPHTDVIAILRATESASLFIQMAVRGSRLYPGKKDFLLIDAADNVMRHDDGKGIYKPAIFSRTKDREPTIITVHCEKCNHGNQFSARPNEAGYTSISRTGYWMVEDIQTHAIAHYGRKCQGCNHRYEGKECKKCQCLNDIAARECCQCGELLVDPNDNLKDSVNHVRVRDLITEEVITKAGNKCLKATFDIGGKKISSWFQSSHLERKFRRHHKEGIKSISYSLNAKGFVVIHGYNDI